MCFLLAGSPLEHLELLADRIITFAELVARENVIPGTDCAPAAASIRKIAWAKLRDGAAIASKKLARLNSKAPLRDE